MKKLNIEFESKKLYNKIYFQHGKDVNIFDPPKVKTPIWSTRSPVSFLVRWRKLWLKVLRLPPFLHFSWIIHNLFNSVLECDMILDWNIFDSVPKVSTSSSWTRRKLLYLQLIAQRICERLVMCAKNYISKT